MWEDKIWNDVKRMRRHMNQVFNSSDFPEETIVQPTNYRQAWTDLREDENNFLIAVEIPGVNKEDIKLETKNRNLIIRAENKQEKHVEPVENDQDEISEDNHCQGYSCHSKSFSGFYRSIRLPENAKIEAINAAYKNGILKITIPKDKESKKQTIEIN